MQIIKGIPPPVSVKVIIVSIWFIYHYLLIAMMCPHKETSDRIGIMHIISDNKHIEMSLIESYRIYKKYVSMFQRDSIANAST